MLGGVALFLVTLGLAATIVVQFRPTHRFATWFDMTAIVPRWRFFALSSQAGAADAERDFHLVVRDRTADGSGAWRPALWNDERRWVDALWNPARHRRAAIVSHCEDIARRPGFARDAWSQQSLPYLILLRCAMTAPGGDDAATARQFGIVETRGRGDRAVAVVFVSGFHSC